MKTELEQTDEVMFFKRILIWLICLSMIVGVIYWATYAEYNSPKKLSDR